MHLHRMTLQAIGPFAGRHTIDFAELGVGGLFLLEGPTGSGKSTIIDAVVFALYGKVASAGASDDRLRSAHAAPGTESLVDLVLETGSGVYRVRRSPAYQRPKKNGSGTTLQQASVTLWRLTSPDAPDEGELLTTRLDEAGLELQRAVGLDRGQFVQTVVLPQGEFAGFLRADPEARRGLLQKVFGTEVYERVQRRLEVMRVEASRGVAAARAEVDRATALFTGAAGAEPDDARATAAGAPIDAWAEHVAAALVEESAVAARAAAGVRAMATDRRGELEAARTTAAACARRDGLRTALAAALAREPERTADRRRLADARTATAVLPLLDAVDRAERARASAVAADERAATAAVASLRAVVDASAEPDVRLKALGVERDRCTAVRATLDRLVDLEAALPGRRDSVAGASRLRAAVLSERDAATARLAELPERRAELAGRTETAAATAAGLATAEHRAAELAGCLAAIDEVALLDLEVEQASSAVTAAAQAAATAVARAAAAAQARILGMAGELAAGLVPGEPCVVCGGIEHPAPAVGGSPVTAADVAAAEAERSTAEQALVRATTRLGTLRERRDQRRLATGGLSASVAQEALTRAAAAVHAAEAARSALPALAAESAALAVAADEAAAAASAATAHAAALEAEVAAGLAEIERDEVEVLAGCDGAASVRERALGLDARVAQIDQWSAALRALVDAEAHLTERSADLAAALGTHGLPDAAAVRGVALDAAALAALELQVEADAAELATLTSHLAELADLPDAPPDVAGAEQAHAAAVALAADAEREAARLGQRAEAAVAALDALVAAVLAHRAAQAEAGPITRMADLAAASGGQNSLTLATYVLGRRFEEVVAAANHRLLAMSDGRYELERSDEREDVRSRRTGLAMRVLDHRTEQARDPRTLSGGETFYVSLCLALGLADVVTAEAGGIDLGTLVVDEGFGSLDAETLEVVLTELGRLREGGRVVAVVSHVEALKQAISERIEVRRLPDGSSTLSVRA